MIEVVKGNKNFERFLNCKLFTSLFNLYEFYFVLLRDYNEFIAREFFYQFKKVEILIEDRNLFNAAKFKLDNTGKGLSYVDCLGYAMSMTLGIKFLTGDKTFENMDNVEFVEK